MVENAGGAPSSLSSILVLLFYATRSTGPADRTPQRGQNFADAGSGIRQPGVSQRVRV